MAYLYGVPVMCCTADVVSHRYTENGRDHRIGSRLYAAQAQHCAALGARATSVAEMEGDHGTEIFCGARNG